MSLLCAETANMSTIASEVGRANVVDGTTMNIYGPSGIRYMYTVLSNVTFTKWISSVYIYLADMQKEIKLFLI